MHGSPVPKAVGSKRGQFTRLATLPSVKPKAGSLLAYKLPLAALLLPSGSPQESDSSSLGQPGKALKDHPVRFRW